MEIPNIIESIATLGLFIVAVITMKNRKKWVPVLCAILGFTSLCIWFYSTDRQVFSMKTQIADLQSETNGFAKEISNLRYLENRWYLRIQKVEVVSLPPNYNQFTRPFRIQAVVNSQNYSFPTETLFWRGRGGGNDVNDAIPLPAEREQYMVKFLLVTSGSSIFASRGVPLTNVVSMQSAEMGRFEVTNLPAKAISEIGISEPQYGDAAIAVVRIDYEISSH